MSGMLFSKIDVLNEDFEAERNLYVGIDGKTIDYIGAEKPEKNYGTEYDGSGRLLMPGFFNAHGHSPMSLMRGYGENMTLQHWLNDRIFPFEAKLTGEAVYWGTLLSMAESLRFGIVSTSDMYYFVEDMARAVEDSGAKSNISRSITNFDGIPFDKLESVKELKRAVRTLNGACDGRIKMESSLHAEYTSDEATARDLAAWTREEGTGMHVHVSETKSEHEECKARHDGKTPVQYLADCGIFDVPAVAAHCVFLEDGDYAVLREKGVTVAANPASNLKLASGICDTARLLREGVPVAVGTDSVASNNSLNFLEEVKLLALLSKVKAGDPTVMSPKEALYAATRAGALAQGRTGSGIIREGMRADLIVIREDTVNMHPVHDMATNIVYSASGSDVVLTMVDGRVLYRDGEYFTIDIERTVRAAETCARNILRAL